MTHLRQLSKSTASSGLQLSYVTSCATLIDTLGPIWASNLPFIQNPLAANYLWKRLAWYHFLWHDKLLAWCLLTPWQANWELSSPSINRTLLGLQLFSCCCFYAPALQRLIHKPRISIYNDEKFKLLHLVFWKRQMRVWCHQHRKEIPFHILPNQDG